MGGLDVLPDGTLLFFDGKALVRATSSGQGNVFVPPASVFGSFVRLVPGNQAVLLGESSTGTIWEISIGMLPYFRTLTTIPFNYDCAYGPSNEILVSALSSFSPARNAVYLVDRGTGATDLLVEVAGNSGPIAVLPSGDLLLGTLSAVWPAPPGSARLLSFPLAKWRGAVGPTHLTEADAVVQAAGLDNIAYLAVDPTGRAVLSDAVNRTVWSVDPSGPAALYAAAGKDTPGYLAFKKGAGPAWFRPFQPAGGPTLLFTSSDWVATNDLIELSALRPTLDTGFSGPIPHMTPVNLAYRGGPPSGLALVIFAWKELSPEAILPGPGFPLFVGLDPFALAAFLPLPLDPSGNATIPLLWPGGSIRVWAQAFDLACSSNPVVW